MALAFGIFDHMERRDDVSLAQLYEERLQLLARADELGFWGYHLAEHHQEPLAMAPSQSVFLAAAAQRTKRIKLGALVYLLPFYHPLRLIEEICMLDNLSDGRLQVGVGRGIAAIEHDFWGHGAADAQARFDETLAILEAGLANDVLTYEGRFYRFDRVPIELRPYQRPHPPFWYAGNPANAGRLGMNFLGGARIAGVDALVSAYHQAAASSPAAAAAEPMIGTVRHLYVAPTDDEAIETASRAWRGYDGHFVRRGWLEGSGPVTSQQGAAPMRPGGPSLGGDHALARQVEALVCGSPETVRRYVKEFAMTSANYFVAAFQWGDLTHAEALRSLELFAAEVMPAV